jgi:hypothetical protein
MTTRDGNSNRRKHDRRSAFIIVEYTVKEGTFRDILKSIGPNGLFISTTRTVAPGQVISLRFPLFSFDELTNVTGSVVRSGFQGFAVELDQPIEELKDCADALSKIVHETDRNLT